MGKIRIIPGASVLLLVSGYASAAIINQVWVGTDSTGNGTIHPHDTSAKFLEHSIIILVSMRFAMCQSHPSQHPQPYCYSALVCSDYSDLSGAVKRPNLAASNTKPRHSAGVFVPYVT